MSRHQANAHDFIVHEAAHVFHNCKRHTMGLPETRTREWPLEIDFGKREMEAAGARNWWKRILARCAPPRRTRR